MGSGNHDALIQALEALRGRGEPPADPARLREARSLLARGAAVAAEANVPRAWIRRACRLAKRKKPAFALVFDSWFEPRPALRRAAADASRFLRFEGPVVVDLEVSVARGRATVLGQLEPPDAAKEVSLRAGGRTRKARVGADGTFRVGSLPRGRADLEIGGRTIEEIPL